MRTPLRTTLSALSAMCVLASFSSAQNQGIQLVTGIDGGVSYPFDARMVPPTGITVEAWVNYDDSTIPTGLFYWPTIARQNVTPNQESWNFRVSAGNTGSRSLQFIVRSSTNQLYSATYTFAAGEFAAFTHLAGTFDGQTIRIFKNAVLVASFTVPLLTEIQNNGGDLRLGNGDPITPGRESWNGVIDEVRIWPMARTAGELAATKDQQLSGMPGGVLIFALNGSYVGDGGSPVGTPFGSINFAPGAPGLVTVMPFLLSLGQPTSTCPRSSEILVGSAPLLGNSNFTFWCVRGPRPANSPAGAVFAADLAAPLSQPPILGVAVAFDLATIVASAVLAPPTDALGNAKFVLPIPNQTGILGLGWVFQFVFLDALCGPQGISASNGLVFAIQ